MNSSEHALRPESIHRSRLNVSGLGANPYTQIDRNGSGVDRIGGDFDAHSHHEKNVLIESDLLALEKALDPLPSLLGKIRPGKGTIGVIQAVRELLERIAEKTDLTGVASAGDAREEVNLVGALFGS